VSEGMTGQHLNLGDTDTHYLIDLGLAPIQMLGKGQCHHMMEQEKSFIIKGIRSLTKLYLQWKYTHISIINPIKMGNLNTLKILLERLKSLY
jgi:hypothetical protein